VPQDSDAEDSELARSYRSCRFADFRRGAPLDVGAWLKPDLARTSGVILSVAHLDDEEREFVLGMLFEELLARVRSLSGSHQLRALVLFDEVHGFMPPHPRNPATKRPLVALMKQARAFGVGVVVATQNPMDLDYRALSNAGFWCIGRLQTEADRERVLDGLSEAGVADAQTVQQTVSRLADRWFVVRNVHAKSGPLLLQPRYAYAWLRGPMTRRELAAARGAGSRYHCSRLITPLLACMGLSPTGIKALGIRSSAVVQGWRPKPSPEPCLLRFIPTVANTTLL
jgi:hypothetical protein